MSFCGDFIKKSGDKKEKREIVVAKILYSCMSEGFVILESAATDGNGEAIERWRDEGTGRRRSLSKNARERRRVEEVGTAAVGGAGGILAGCPAGRRQAAL